MNFQHLITFCTVLMEKSMTAAAQKLFLTQPAVSQQIRQLEEYLGVELLVRGVRQIQSSPQGHLLFEYAQKIIRLSKEAEVAIQTMGGEVTGPLRVATLNSLGLHLLGPVFALFLKNNKNVKLHLEYAKGQDLINGVVKGDFDIILLPDAEKEYGEDPKDCKKIKISYDEMWLVVSSRAEVPAQIKLKDIMAHPFVSIIGEYPGFESLLSKSLRKEDQKITSVFESSNVGTLKRIIEAGLGWGFLPSHSIKKQIEAGRLKRIQIQDFEYTMDLCCYVNKTRSQLKSTEVFLKALEQQR
ncbi:MAG: LysR family transcriptional regulator [Bdellovibrionota bacterium]